MLMHTSTAARDRRWVPGSLAFNAISGPATVVCGTRTGAKRYSADPAHYLIAPLDRDPGSMRWPVNGASITVMACGAAEEFTLRLTQALIADGAALVVVIRDGRASMHTQPPQEMTRD